MERLEALALVATIQAAFPAGNAGPETTQLYANLLEPYPADQAGRAVRNIIETRTDPFLPTWAEVQQAITAERPRPRALPEPEGVPPTAEAQAAMDALTARGEQRTSDLQRGVRLRYLRDKQAEHEESA